MSNQTLSKPVISKQTKPHEQLTWLVEKHRHHSFQKPIARYNQKAFDQIAPLVEQHQGALLLDSGCGTGDSTRQLAELYPQALVIGVDRSADRLSRQRANTPDNCLLIRADLIDFWRLANQANWPIDEHYLLYPNPEPKPGHLKRRFHGHPVFPTLTTLSRRLQARSNWWVYLAELQQALSQFGIESQISNISHQSAPPITLFEQKYRQSGHQLWRLDAQLADD